MQIEKHKSLRDYNTFGIDCKAERFTSISSVADLKELLREAKNESLFILGGGSNMLLTKDIEALVVHINIKGISIYKETDDHIYIEAMAGENWHEFVLYCIDHGYGGIENLSLIPGNMGTAPIQNIGAYGVELEQVFWHCEAIEIDTEKLLTFNKEDCQFGYRNSIFKNEAKGKYIITKVCLRLSKRNHKKSISYGAIRQQLEIEGVLDTPSIGDISKAVIAIRQSKLPDPTEIGNSGSFFKNPVVDANEFARFTSNFPDAPFYKVTEDAYKIPAGWLIEQAGFKGKRFGDAGVHEKQALVLVNHGNAKGSEIWNLAMRIQKEVKVQFDITLTPEVNVI